MSEQHTQAGAGAQQAAAANGNGHGHDDESWAKFGKLMRSALIGSSKAGNPVLDEFQKHFDFDADPSRLPILMDRYPYHLIVNLQAAIDAFREVPGRESREVGIKSATHDDSDKNRLANLLLPPSLPMPAPTFGLVEEERREAGFKHWMRCVVRGAVIFRDADGPGVIWIQSNWPGSLDGGVRIEVMAPTAARAATIIAEIRKLSVEHSPYRGQCVTVAVIKGVLKPQFVERPGHIAPEEVILPPGLLEKVEKHVVGIAHQRPQLIEAGCHLKRGLLLWGRPGTGKTHLIRYLAGRLPDHTVLLLPGRQLENLHRMHELVELCEPGIVVLDDFDYIAEDRTLAPMAGRHQLFELLDALDGMNPDADLLFIMTTNRADTLEPAIAARPGRVDQAAEIPPPDDECRKRLFALYARGVTLDMEPGEIDVVIKRTDGVTGSFFKELLRRATFSAAKIGRQNGDGRVRVTNDDVIAALDEMLDPDNPMSARLLGLAGSDHALLGADGGEGGEGEDLAPPTF